MLAWYAVGLFAVASRLPGVDPVSAFHYLHVSLAVLADLVALGLFYWLAWRLHGPLAATVWGLGRRPLARFGLAFAGVLAATFLPLLALNPVALRTSVQILLGRPSWESV